MELLWSRYFFVSSPVLPMRFEQWLEFHRKQKPLLMKDVRTVHGSVDLIFPAADSG